MTQPRKEQIKDIQAKFSVLNPKLASHSVPPDSGPVLGLQSSKTFTTTGISINPYQEFLNGTVTKVFGGVVDTSPGYYVGVNQGSFIITSGQQFSIAIPQVNGGNPITVTIQISDVVTIGSTPVVTTSRLAARINSTIDPYLAAYAVAHPLEPVPSSIASNFNGHLQLRTPFIGDSGSIVVRDVTFGLLNTILSSGASPTISILGKISPKRGVVTLSPDGLGGFSPTRFAGGDPCITRQVRRVHMGGFNYVPDVSIGQDIYAKFSGSASLSSVTVSFYTTGVLQSQVITSSSNFTALDAGNTLGLTITDPTLGSPVVLSINFSSISAASTPQTVVNLINAQWNSSLGFGSTISPTQGSVRILKPIFSFSTSTFGLILNGNTPITVNVNSSITTRALLVSAINSAISSASQGSQGTATLSGSGTAISSLQTNGALSSVEITAGTNGDMSALDEMGISPGEYHGSTVAELYGLDEIRIYNPSRAPGSSISISGSVSTLGRLGIPAAGTFTVSRGEEPAVPGSEVKILVSEAMEFGEIADDYDAVIEQFSSDNSVSFVDPVRGHRNAGIPVSLGPDGKLSHELIERDFDRLSVESLSLGSLSVGSPSKSRVTAPYDPSSGIKTLFHTFPPSSNGSVIRVYVDSNGSTVYTRNARWDNAGSWSKDVEGVASNAVIVNGPGGITKNMYRQPSEASPWDDTVPNGWRDTVVCGDPTSPGFVQLGGGEVDNLSSNLVPRVKYYAVPNSVILISESISDSGIGTRVYHEATSPFRSSTSINARFDGVNWNKDVSGQPSLYRAVSNEFEQTFVQFAANNSPWSSWDNTSWLTQFGTNNSNDFHNIGGRIILGDGIGINATGRGLSRITVNHADTTNNHRTLITSWTGGNGVNTYLYRGVGFRSPDFDNIDVVIQSTNAYWDQAGGFWQKERTTDNAFLILTHGSATYNYTKTGNSPMTWPDSTWNQVSNMSRLGLHLPYSEDLNNTVTGTKNQLGPANIVKAYGVWNDATATLGDSWNVSNISHPGGTNFIQVSLSSAMINASSAGYAVIAGVVNNIIIKCMTLSFSASSFEVGFYRSDTNAANNNGNGGIPNNFSFVVLGYQ